MKNTTHLLMQCCVCKTSLQEMDAILISTILSPGCDIITDWRELCEDQFALVYVYVERHKYLSKWTRKNHPASLLNR